MPGQATGELACEAAPDVMAKVEPLVTAAAGLRQGDPQAVDVAVDLGGRRMAGTVGNVYGDAVVRPMVPKTSATYAEKRASGMTVENARVKAEQDWTGGTFDGECVEAAYELVWGAEAPFDVPLADPVPPGEPRPEGVTTRFGVLARRLWEPLLAAETLERL